MKMLAKNADFCPATATLVWGLGMVQRMTVPRDASSYYIAIFSGSKCASLGDVYRISDTWYVILNDAQWWPACPVFEVVITMRYVWGRVNLI